jgi:hypothetical protein
MDTELGVSLWVSAIPIMSGKTTCPCVAGPNKDSYTPDTEPVAHPAAAAIDAHSVSIL